LIHFSSSEVYGSAQYEPMCENHPIGASTPYAAAKAACDFICMSYVKTFGCNISILRPFNNYGPRQNAGSYAGVIPLTINRLMNGENPIIYGDGLQTRDYIYVEDTVRAAILLAGSDLQGEIINVGSGHDVSIKWLVSEIMKLVGWEKTREIEIQPARPGDVRRHIANVLKAKDLLGFQHKVGMEEGLKKTVAWYLSKSGIYQEGREWIDIIFRLF
jgi:UDP-glucose 4-epimerase